jgi:hypothetical protein
MLALAIFVSLCIASVLFLLRFLFALHAESKLARAHPAAMASRGPAYGVQARRRVRDSAPVLTMVRSDSLRQAVGARPVITDAPVARERKSQFKGA